MDAKMSLAVAAVPYLPREVKELPDAHETGHFASATPCRSDRT